MGNMRISKKGYPVAIGIFAIAILLTFILENDYYFVILCQIACYYIAALGMNFITGMLAQPNLGSAGIFALGAYTSALISMKFGVSPFVTIIPALAVGWLVGKLLGYPSLRVEGVYLALTTMVFAEVIRIFLMNMTDLTGGAAGLRGIPHYNMFGITVTKFNHIAMMYAVIALFMSYLAYHIVRSRWGRSLIAIRDNVEAVGSCGINVSKMKVKAFTVCCMFVAVGGAMYGHYATYLNPTSFSQQLSSNFVIILIIGGRGMVSGVLVGTVVVILLPELLRSVGTYYMLIYYTLFMLSIILLPGGIVPTLMRAKDVLRSDEFIKMMFRVKQKGRDGNV
jgi:branched-chain amino acid transport system permease protein